MMCCLSHSQLLAGARVTDIDNHQRGVLHMAVEGDFPSLLSVLLENNADPDLTDEAGNNGRVSCDRLTASCDHYPTLSSAPGCHAIGSHDML